MFCYKCGRELEDECKFCAYCGAKFSFKLEKKDNRSFCQSCGIHSDGDFCMKCGKNNRKPPEEDKKKYISINKEDPRDYAKSVAVLIMGFVILVAGAMWFIYSFSTILSDISNEDYTYVAPLTYHERMMVYTCIIGFIAQYAGIIMVVGNRKTAAKNNAIYPTVISGISVVLVVVVLVWSVTNIIPYFHICDKCGNVFFGKENYDAFGEYVFCHKCDKLYWGF